MNDFDVYVDDVISAVQKAYDRRNQKNRKLVDVDFRTRRVERTRADKSGQAKDKIRKVWDKHKESVKLTCTVAVAAWVAVVFVAGFVLLYM